MFNPTAYVIEGFINRLEEIYFQTFGQEEPGYPGTLGVVARAALERIADSDALYHNLEHTIMVTLVGRYSDESKQGIRPTVPWRGVMDLSQGANTTDRLPGTAGGFP